jgi:chromosome partitioning protein
LTQTEQPSATTRRTQVFAVANQKGGVGKTTTAVNLAASLARLGHRTLLVDLDPQGNATMGSGVDKSALHKTIYTVLLGIDQAETVRIKTDFGYDLLPANRELAGAEVELVDLESREHRLAIGLATIASAYDMILVDCPPSLSMLTLNGLCAANGVVIPMQCEYFALEGLSDLVNSIKRVHAGLNRELRIIGLLRVMFDPRMTLSQQVSDQLERHFAEKVFKTVIPRNVRLAEAPSHGQPVLRYDGTSRGSQAYLGFAQELVDRLGLARRPAREEGVSA